jgi:hypothetical protein
MKPPLIRSTAAVIALSVLPSFMGWALLLAQAPGLPYDSTVSALADKNMNYWFLALAAIAIASWSFIAKWLLNQLESQREANAQLVTKLVNYMEVDHAKTLVVMDSVTKILADVVKKLDGQTK